jgi:hypothetical protein
MTRKECYDFIKKNGLGETIKAVYHRNYTNLPTEELQLYIVSNNSPCTEKGATKSPANKSNKGAKKHQEEASDAPSIPNIDWMKRYQVLVYAITSLMLSIDDKDVKKDISDAIISTEKYIKENK